MGDAIREPASRADATWTAASPWKGGTPALSRLTLAVAPSVTVPLAPAASQTAHEPPEAQDDVPPGTDAPPEMAAPTNDRMRLRLAEAELEAASG